MNFEQETLRRRTFAIVSHPDAGKTTLTEKLLLFGGAIRVAGAVKSNKITKAAMSDFMEIEKQRGISVATSVMGFEYRERKINILDTPGHKDFAEDTYRTLSAADSVIVVIDVAKGVEEQTERLVEVCRMRRIPIIVFINKLDRPGKSAVDLLDEIEEKLHLNVTPLSWPVGMGLNFKGVYNLYESKLNLFSISKQTVAEDVVEIAHMDDPLLDKHLDEQADMLREDIELITGVYPEFETSEYLSGNICPVFFGSAVNNFGVQELLDCFIDIAPAPADREAEERKVEALEKDFSGFIFKIHANMDPNHRTRIAFLKVVSGKFERNTNYHHVRLNRNFKFASPTAFMADKKSVIDEAYPGDIVGLADTGNFKIGDVLSAGETLHFKGIPAFSPEHFRYIENVNSMKYKQLNKGIDQLIDEGVAQLFNVPYNARRIIGTAGALQFDVIQYRLDHEYGASCRYEPISIHKACWISADDPKKLQLFMKEEQKSIAEDKDGKPVFLASSPWRLNRMKEEYPQIQFHFSSEFE